MFLLELTNFVLELLAFGVELFDLHGVFNLELLWGMEELAQPKPKTSEKSGTITHFRHLAAERFPQVVQLFGVFDRSLSNLDLFRGFDQLRLEVRNRLLRSFLLNRK